MSVSSSSFSRLVRVDMSHALAPEKHHYDLQLRAQVDPGNTCTLIPYSGCGRPSITVWGNLLSCLGIGYPMCVFLTFGLKLGVRS